MFFPPCWCRCLRVKQMLRCRYESLCTSGLQNDSLMCHKEKELGCFSYSKCAAYDICVYANSVDADNKSNHIFGWVFFHANKLFSLLWSLAVHFSLCNFPLYRPALSHPVFVSLDLRNPPSIPPSLVFLCAASVRAGVKCSCRPNSPVIGSHLPLPPRCS